MWLGINVPGNFVCFLLSSFLSVSMISLSILPKFASYLNHRQSKWSSESSPCEIVTIVSEDCRSLGDALRDIDAKGIIKSDFVLVNGDVVASLKLKQMIEEHK